MYLDRYADGQEIEYTITEGKVDGYETTVDGYDVTNTHIPETVEISGTKTWDDANDRAGARPKAITIHLLADGKIVDSRTVAERDQWSYRFTGLDRYADGQEIVYSISEDTVKDYQSEFDGYDVTNHYTPGKTNVAGIKIWKDDNNADGRRPDSITINLLADDEQIDSKTVTEEDGWRWNFTDLDEMKDGRKIVYTITEEEVEGYESTADGYNVTNICERSKTEVSGEKTWDDNDDQEGKRPESITVNLLADGKKVQNTTVKESTDGSWKYQFTDLDMYADGKEIIYTVTEDPVDGYETSVDGYDITNTYVAEEPEEEEIRISGQVFWEDEDDKEGRRPEQTEGREGCCIQPDRGHDRRIQDDDHLRGTEER